MPRPPKPARLKLVEGRSPGRDSGGRKVPESPKFIRQAPDAPDWLDAEALAEWRRVAPTLERLDLLKPGIGRSCPRTARPGPSTSRRFSGSAPKASQLPHRNPVSCTGTRR